MRSSIPPGAEAWRTVEAPPASVDRAVAVCCLLGRVDLLGVVLCRRFYRAGLGERAPMPGP